MFRLPVGFEKRIGKRYPYYFISQKPAEAAVVG